MTEEPSPVIDHAFFAGDPAHITIAAFSNPPVALWVSFPPARFLTGLISQDHRKGFLVINISLVAFGVWCIVWPVRQEWRSAYGLAWLWVVIELINGIGHPVWSVSQRGYTPGVVTAPLLLVLALYMASQLRFEKRSAAQQGDAPDGASRRR